MSIAIVYKSILGQTRKYALLLSKELGADMYRFHEVGKDTLSCYSLIIVSSGTYFGKMPLVGFLKKQQEALKSKKIVVIAIGAIPTDTKESKKSYESLPQDFRERSVYFKFSGNPSVEKLYPVIEIIKKMYKKSVL